MKKDDFLYKELKASKKSLIKEFCESSKALLSKNVSQKSMDQLFAIFLEELFAADNSSWVEEFCNRYHDTLKHVEEAVELYMLFANLHVKKATAIMLKDPSKIDEKTLGQFFKKIDKANHHFMSSHCKRDINRSQFELQQMFDAITDPLFVVDKNMKLLRVNKFLKERLKAKDYLSLLNKDASKIKYNGEPMLRKSDLKEVFKNAAVHVTNINSKDEKTYFTQYAYPIKESDKKSANVISALVYKKDMSSRKELEERVEHLDRLATIGRLSTVIAHEIRNPLSGIGLSASLLKKKLEKNWKYFDSLDNILDGIDRIETVILKLLDFSKPKKTKRVRANILDPITEALFFIKSRAIKSSIKIVEDYQPSLPYVLIDPDQITQVIINLLLNAIHAIKKDGEIKIEAFISDNHDVLLNIIDSGIGIKKELLPHIYEPFFTTKADGTGLGLAISKNILMQNDVDISVQSEPRTGTTFTLSMRAYNEI
ncbi:nitrogen regulation protein NR(II) [Thermodesulfobacteriota bacterium]